jgi:hypothetical protein
MTARGNALALIVETSRPRAKVTREVATLFDTGGKPQTMVSDRHRSESDPRFFLRKGTKFISNASLKFMDDCKIDLQYIAASRPTQNAFMESFCYRIRDVPLNETPFPSLKSPRPTGCLAQRLQHRTPTIDTPGPVGPVAYLCRSKCSFRPPGVRRPRGFFHPNAECRRLGL